MALILGTAGDDQLVGTPLRDVIDGRAGDDRLDGGWGDAFLIRGNGNDVLIGDRGRDRLIGGPGDDHLIDSGFVSGDEDIADDSGARGPIRADLAAGIVTGDRCDRIERVVTLIGTRFADHLAGGPIGVTLDGGPGDDVLTGRERPTRLIAGGDVLTGGRGRWIASAPPPGDPDRIRGFVPDDGDRIDFSAVWTGERDRDDDPPRSFTFVGTSAFTDRGQVGYRIVGGETTVEATTGTGPDLGLRLVIDGVWTLTAERFVL